MPKRVSIAEARDHLPALVRSAEEGHPVELMRRGKLVAVLVSSQEYEKLRNGRPDLWAAIQKFRSEHDLSDLRVEEVYANVRDPSPGPETEW
jgi:prevent-host-death family protein